jgi:phosphate:Na+ symporter
MQKEDYNMKSGMIYSDLFSSLEKVGDHVINVSEAVAGEI